MYSVKLFGNTNNIYGAYGYNYNLVVWVAKFSSGSLLSFFVAGLCAVLFMEISRNVFKVVNLHFRGYIIRALQMIIVYCVSVCVFILALF